MGDEMLTILMTAAITGALSTIGTVIALRVHIFYLRDHINRIEQNVNTVHKRIDNLIESRVMPPTT